MTLKFIIPFCLCLALMSCKEKAQTIDETEKQDQSNQLINESDIAKLKYVDFILDPKVEKQIESWHQYIQLNEIISRVKKADFSDFKDNKSALKILTKDLKKNIPATIKTAAVQARVMVIETKLYKLEDIINLNAAKKEELISCSKEFLESFSNLNFQLNKKLEHDSQKIQKPI